MVKISKTPAADPSVLAALLPGHILTIGTEPGQTGTKKDTAIIITITAVKIIKNQKYLLDLHYKNNKRDLQQNRATFLRKPGENRKKQK